MSPSGYEWITLGIAIIVTSLALAASHWLPLLCKLPRLHAYVWGTALLWLGFSAWRLANGDWRTTVGLAAICLAGGLTVISAYRWDAFVARAKSDRNKVKMIEAADDTLKKS